MEKLNLNNYGLEIKNDEDYNKLKSYLLKEIELNETLECFHNIEKLFIDENFLNECEYEWDFEDKEEVTAMKKLKTIHNTHKLFITFFDSCEWIIFIENTYYDTIKNDINNLII